MKKLFLVLVCLIAASTCFAQTGAVYSVNIVGFQKTTTAPRGLRMISMPFDTDDFDLNNVIGGQLYASKNDAEADKVFLWDADGQAYKIYYLRTKAGVITNKWVKLGGDESVPSTDAFLFNYAGGWLRSEQTTTQEMVVVGDVVEADAVTNILGLGLNFAGYPFSTPRPINEINLNNGNSSKNDAEADKIFLWNVEEQKYSIFYLRNKTGVITNKWVLLGGDESIPATNVISPNEGFWYRIEPGKIPVTWTAMKPYTLD